MTEAEKRLHRCALAGHRPEKIALTEEEAKAWLSGQIDTAISAGFTTFITGCGMGVDLWAAQLVIGKRATNPAIRLIAAPPYPGFHRRWKEDWRAVYEEVISGADLVRPVCPHYEDDSFRKRGEWMVRHSSLLIALYSGEEGSTRAMVDLARQENIRVIERIAGK
ncbi:MAG: SLOG family protein [Clostridia bacterium]|nr:SLOG family protein [Clostridia bacterium]